MHLLLSLYNNPPNRQKAGFNAVFRTVHECGRQRLGAKYTPSLDPPFKPRDAANAIHGLRANGSQEEGEASRQGAEANKTPPEEPAKEGSRPRDAMVDEQ
ncbi:hypothetical protein ColLi_12191 [Colletotrichum liriopes]|uniref:Uncharacterized protein n=1 Tax=Colletotrichum liriopes TaxID=708192 RepID=A0AA37LZD8_9PEZI|nr:hypothetical protein ColLi_12191 [Colletotrichum liriopes]